MFTFICFLPLQSDVNYTSLFGEQDEESVDLSFRQSITKQSDVLFTRLIRRLTMVVMQQVPPFWRLAVAIFNGKFTKVRFIIFTYSYSFVLEHTCTTLVKQMFLFFDLIK